MKEMLESSVYLGVLLTFALYALGVMLKRRYKSVLCNPMLITIAGLITILSASGMSVESYERGTQWISYLLTPATVCLAVPLYEQFELLKRNWHAVLMGILAGALSSLTCILALSLVLGFDHTTYVTFLPKSITTAIGIGVSEELGGYVALTVVVIVLTGVLGNIFAEGALRIMRINDPVAKGVAIGSASHAVGTARAMEMGAIEGAMSSLSIAVSGLLTVVLAPLFALVY